MSGDRKISIRPDLVDNLDRTWVNLAGPGARWTGAQRSAIATEARRARNEEPAGDALSPAATEAARLLASNPAAAGTRPVRPCGRELTRR